MHFGKRAFAVLSFILLVFSGFSYAPAQKARRQRRAALAPSQPPAVALAANITSVTLCPRDGSSSSSQVQLKAQATSSDANPLRYTWTTTGGRIIGEGPNPTWDLSDTRPGTYTAMVEVDNGGERDCTAFSSTAVTVDECPPLREVASCPNISLSCPDTVAQGTPLNFAVDITGGTPNVTPLYKWTVSSGNIISGQGTPSITVDTTGLSGQDIKAIVEVGGYGLICSTECATQVPARVEPQKFDEFGNISRNDEKARLDNFAIQLQTDPGAQGYVIVYGGRTNRAEETQRRAQRAKEYLVNTRGLDASRIVTLIGGPRENLSTELWIVPRGATPPRLR